jgi:hypothetical protein
MKPKNSLSSAFAFAKRHPLLVIMLLSLVCQLFQVRFHAIQTSPDTASYQLAGEKLMHGEIDIRRTPSYPFIFAACQAVSAAHVLRTICLVQIVVFFFSIACCYKTLKRLNLSGNITFLATLIYGTCPLLLLANVAVLTESFASSVSVFLIYFFVKWFKKSDWLNTLGILCCTLFLSFLRPSFIYLSIAFAIITVILFITTKDKHGWQLLSVVGITAIMLFGYCKQIEAKTGVFTTTDISCHNDFNISYNIGFLTPENVNDSIIRQRVIEYKKRNQRKTIWDVPKTLDLPIKQRADELKHLKSIDRMGWYSKGIKDNFFKSLGLAYNGYGNNQTDFTVIYLLIALTGGYLVYIWYRKRNCPIITLFLWLMCTGNIMVNVIGSFAEFTRLFLPSTPLLIMLIASMCNLFKIQNVSTERQLP